VGDRPAEALDQRARRRQVDDLDRDPRLAQAAHAALSGARVRVERADDDPADAGLDQRQRAGRRAAVLIARLERDVGGRAARIVTLRARVTQRLDLGVRLTATVVPAFAERRPVADEDAADRRVRRRVRDRARGELARAREVDRFGAYGVTSTPFQKAT